MSDTKHVREVRFIERAERPAEAHPVLIPDQVLLDGRPVQVAPNWWVEGNGEEGNVAKVTLTVYLSDLEIDEDAGTVTLAGQRLLVERDDFVDLCESLIAPNRQLWSRHALGVNLPVRSEVKPVVRVRFMVARVVIGDLSDQPVTPAVPASANA